MAVSQQTVRELLEAEDWTGCAEHAVRALAAGEWSKPERAFLLFARSKSLSNLDRYTMALEPGRLAVYLAEEGADFDFLGRCLLNLAWIQHKTAGMESAAVESQRRFLELFPRYKEIRDRYLSAMYNLGVYLRAAGQFAEALEQFRTTYLDAKKRDDLKAAHLNRSSAVWEALRLGRVAEAEVLIREGATYRTDDDRLLASHALDQAQLALVKNGLAAACEHAIVAAIHARAMPEFFARSLDILHRVAQRSGDPETAMVAAMVAKLLAESCDRHDMVAQACGCIRSLALQHPTIVAKLMPTLDGTQHE